MSWTVPDNVSFTENDGLVNGTVSSYKITSLEGINHFICENGLACLVNVLDCYG